MILQIDINKVIKVRMITELKDLIKLCQKNEKKEV
jgi:hypothetical protein